LQKSQGYFIRILQHFAKKRWNITNFVTFFQAVMKFLSRPVEFKILVNWGVVHWNQGLILNNENLKNTLNGLLSTISRLI
jgi:hypothetical protein